MRNEIIKDMDINEYHRPENGLSNSGMKYLLDCPARYHAQYLDPTTVKPETPDHFKIGQALHCMVLEPAKFFLLNYIMPKVDKRTTVGKAEFKKHSALSAGKNILDQEQYDKVCAMHDSLFKRIKWLKDVLKDAAIEESFFWQDPETGVQLKSRPDIYTGDFYIDLKTTSEIRADTYTRSITKFAYDRQAALAREALERLHGIKYSYFMHVVVEESAPHLTACYILDDGFLEKGEREFRQAAATYKQCLETNEWPDYGAQVQQLYLPAWLR